jgi:hypothetical protein
VADDDVTQLGGDRQGLVGVGRSSSEDPTDHDDDPDDCEDRPEQAVHVHSLHAEALTDIAARCGTDGIPPSNVEASKRRTSGRNVSSYRRFFGLMLGPGA